MVNSIKYFHEECIKKFEKLEDEFMKNPVLMAEYVQGIKNELHELGIIIIKESLEV
ncbi:MAG: hypothetical protein Q4B26_20140 [Eubacteriales bacterium]|nr:hypothetical protein [Eubacteriales bacterium]